MKKLPEISMAEWEEAEVQLRQVKITPQPKGTITPEQYAQLKGLSVSRSRFKLNRLCKANLAMKEKWHTDSKVLTVYRTVKK